MTVTGSWGDQSPPAGDFESGKLREWSIDPTTGKKSLIDTHAIPPQEQGGKLEIVLDSKTELVSISVEDPVGGVHTAEKEVPQE